MKKKIYLEACLQQCHNFSPIVTSVDGVLGVSEADNLKMIASRLITKCRQTYSRTYGYFKSNISINLVGATHRCVRGSRVPAHNISV